MAHDPGSRNRLNQHSLRLFAGETLFDRLARAVCRAECLPRKELYESWEVARRVRRRFRGGRVLDLAAGHGLVAFALLLLDDTSPEAICVDPRRPDSFGRLAAELERDWPRLAGRVRYLREPLDRAPARPGDLVVCAHGCGDLTDRALDLAVAVRARVALLPCCHPAAGEKGGLEGWLDENLAVDVMRATRLREAGYAVTTLRIPEEVTPKNRLLLGMPTGRSAVQRR